MSSILIKNIGTLVTGQLESPIRQANSIFIKDGIVQAIGNNLESNRRSDHRRQRHHGDPRLDRFAFAPIHRRIHAGAKFSTGWITNYMHGGVTSLISAGELHLPGLPLPPDARTALSVAIVTKTLLRQPAAHRVSRFMPELCFSCLD